MRRVERNKETEERREGQNKEDEGRAGSILEVREEMKEGGRKKKKGEGREDM